MATTTQMWTRTTGAALLLCVLLHANVVSAQVEPSRREDRASLLRTANALRLKAVALRKVQTEKTLTTSRALFAESARLFEAAHANKEAAASYLEVGEIDFRFSRYIKARSAYAQVLRLGNEGARCAAMSRIARSYATTGALALAERRSGEAWKLCQSLGEKAEAEALEARGETLDFSGKHGESAELFARAVQLFAKVNDDNARGESLLMLAFALYANGKQEEGLEAAVQALEVWKALKDTYGLARVRAALGIFAITKGEFEAAQCNYQIAEPLLHTLGNRDEEGSVLNGLGYVSRETGDWQKSLEYYRRASAAFVSVPDLLGQHEAMTGMGKALLASKRYDEVRPHYAAELRLARKSGDIALVASSLGDTAALYEAQGKYAVAESFYRRTLEAYQGAKHLYGEGDTLLQLGRLQALRGKYPEALELLEQANGLKEKTGQIEEVAKVQYEMARVYQSLGRLEEAKSSIERTIDIVEQQRITISQFDSRASYFGSVHRYYAQYIDLLMMFHKQNPARGFDKKAFEASERSKVRSLLDLLTTSAQDASCDELLGKQLERANRRPARELLTKSSDELLPPTLTLDQVQTEIEDDGTVLLEYALGESRSYVWAVDRNRILSYELPGSDDIRRLVLRLRNALLPTQVGDAESASDYQARVHAKDGIFGATSRELSNVLIGPIDLAGATRVLVVPDGSLQYAPFAALPSPAPVRASDFLISRYEIDILPSASALGTLRKAAAKKMQPTKMVAVFADPVFETDDPRVTVLHSRKVVRERPRALTRAIRDTNRKEYIPRLPASRDEANAITAVFGGANSDAVHIALDFDASRNNVRDGRLERFRLIHFATHGIVDSRHPEMSGLVLSLVNVRGGGQDGYLRMGDIYKLRLAADLVVLSSCDSALGKDLNSEGIIGLPRAFLYAGAKSVIASSWKVDDEATSSLMRALYTRIHNGESPGSALRWAQLEMLKDERWKKPYYWAAFTLQGDYR